MASEDRFYLCTYCNTEKVEFARWKLGHHTCMACGEYLAKRTRHTIAPMHKSNYMLITNLDDLRGLNNKGGLIK